MKLKTLSLSLTFASMATVAQTPWQPQQWPVMRHYDANHLLEISLPLGGIGTGTVGLGGRGELRDWEIMNVPARGFSTLVDGNDAPFFAIYTRSQGKDPQTKMLAGPLYDSEYLHAEGRPVNNHGLPRFQQASFDAAYPFGQVLLSDQDMPVKVRIRGFNPLVPCDEETSGLPLAVLSYEVTNLTDKPLEASVCGNIRNFIGRDGQLGFFNGRHEFIPSGLNSHGVNTFKYDEQTGVQGILSTTESTDSTHQAWGSYCLATDARQGVTHRLMSADNSWSISTLDLWDDFSADGQLKAPVANARKTVGHDQDPMASLCVSQTIPAGQSRFYNFYLTWNFPNRYGWAKEVVGNWYSQHHPDPWQTAVESASNMARYEEQTLGFVRALMASSYPDAVKEAALFNLNVLRSQTVYRLPSGHLMGWEGTFDRAGSCEGSCTHVWNYETATAFLFGNLARSMRQVETEYATWKENGAMAFRVGLPLHPQEGQPGVAADGQMGCIMKFYRDWQLSGDMEFLRSYWPAVRSNLAYAWVPGGWDGNMDGVMEGSQHNTMDVNYFGPNPQMGFWYMGALRAGREMALAMKDKAFARRCDSLFQLGSAWMDANLFNGEYYEHRITDPNTFQFMDPRSPDIPPFQLGSGCLVDQLVGQYMAHICGLGYLGDPKHIRKTLESIMHYNFLPDFSNYFNNMRSYVLGHEAGLVMAAYPKGRLEVPFPYFREAMTGFEYTAAVGMLQEGMEADGLRCIQAIRDRFDGAKRNPFSEPECGHHYARSMASWSAILAMSDFLYSGIDHTMRITDKPGTWFWSNGYAWGTLSNQDGKSTLKVLGGSLSLRQLTLGAKTYKRKIELSQGQEFTIAASSR